MSKKLILYMSTISPPARAVLMTGAELGIEFDLKCVDLLNFEHRKSEYIKINPQHTVPLLDDNGTLIADSHAICAYLCEKYGKTDRLYPKDLVKRAQVNARLHFDSGHLFARLRFLFEPILYYKSSEMPADRIQYIQVACDILERFLENGTYVCGDDMTIADLCLVATASSVADIVPLDPIKYKRVIEWIKHMSQLPYYKKFDFEDSLQATVHRLRVENKIKI